MVATNLGKRYKDRQNNRRRIMYWLRHHMGKVEDIFKKLKKK